MFSTDILEVANAEPIEGIVIGKMGWSDYGKECVPQYDQQPKGKLLTWQEAEPLLTYDYDNGYGAPGCNSICAWTKSRVIFVTQYDGSTSINWMPRNPGDHMPKMPGG